MAELEQGLREYLDGTDGFFSGARISAEVGCRIVKSGDMERLRNVLEEDFHLEIAELRSSTEQLERGLAEVTGIRIAILPRQSAPFRERTMLTKGPCRSGTTTHHEGDLVVLGDVNPGAEVTAAGDIIIFGALMGAAHAGINGDEEAVIAALSLRPAQLRIGCHLGMVSNDRKRKKAGAFNPEVAFLRGGDIVVEAFSGQFQQTRGWEVQ